MDLTIDELPNEVLRIILSYVTHPLDQKRVSLVSRHFRDVMRTISRHRFKLNLESNPQAEFRDCSEFPFTSIDFGLYRVRKLRYCLDNWRSFGNNIAEISIKFVALNFPQLLEHLSMHMPNLKVLKLIQNALGRLKPKKLKKENTSFLPEKQFLFPRVDTLDLSQGQCSSDMANYLVLCCPNLKRLMLSDEMRDFSEEKFCQFLHKWTSEGIKIVFYLQTTNITPLLNAPTENFRIECLKIHPSMEKLQEFFTSPREIGTLTLISHSEIPRWIFKPLFRNEGSIENLALSLKVPVDFGILRLIAQSRAVKSVDLRLDRIFHSPTFTRKLALKIRSFRLIIPGLESDIIYILNRLRYVQKLVLEDENCVESQLFDIILPLIFEWMTDLRDLTIYCSVEGESRAELSNSSFHGISDLQHLEKLLVGDCKYSLTEAVFEEFQLPQLKRLTIRVKEISLQGLKILARNCPNIEILKIHSESKGGDKKEDLKIFIKENFPYIRKVQVC